MLWGKGKRTSECCCWSTAQQCSWLSAWQAFIAQIMPMLVLVSAVPALPSMEGKVSPWQCENGLCEWALVLPSVHPGKQWRSGLNYISYTWYIFLCLFWTFLTSRPFFCGAPRGPGQNEYGKPLHAWDKRSEYHFLVFSRDFFSSCCFYGSWCFTGCQVCLVTCTAAPLGKKVSRRRACISGQL